MSVPSTKLILPQGEITSKSRRGSYPQRPWIGLLMASFRGVPLPRLPTALKLSPFWDRWDEVTAEKLTIKGRIGVARYLIGIP